MIETDFKYIWNRKRRVRRNCSVCWITFFLSVHILRRKKPAGLDVIHNIYMYLYYIGINTHKLFKWAVDWIWKLFLQHKYVPNKFIGQWHFYDFFLYAFYHNIMFMRKKDSTLYYKDITFCLEFHFLNLLALYVRTCD